jgi:hypothetical protein
MSKLQVAAGSAGLAKEERLYALRIFGEVVEELRGLSQIVPI